MAELTERLPLRQLPTLTAPGAAQMAIDSGLLEAPDAVTVRRYSWSPPAVSLGKFQRLPAGKVLPFDVVRRPSGGRAVLHGAEFEWSFAVVFPPGSTGEAVAGAERVDAPYSLVSAAMAEALERAGVAIGDEREEPYRRSALCFSTSLRHDLHTTFGKVVAVAQVRHKGVALVHGSVLMRRPPAALTAALERLVGEPWRGEGLAAALGCVDDEQVWVSFNDALRERLHEASP